MLQPPIEAGTSGKMLQQAPSHPLELEPQNIAEEPMDMGPGDSGSQDWGCIIVEEPEE